MPRGVFKTKPTGRPLIDIDWKIFEELCHIQCTQSEIASFLKIHHETLIRRVEDNYKEPFASVYKKYSEGGKSSLRRNQFRMSETNSAMAIWLGKQWLGQKDHEEKTASPIQESIDMKNAFYASQYEMQKLKKELDDLKSKTNPELQRSNSQIQSMDRSSQLR